MILELIELLKKLCLSLHRKNRGRPPELPWVIAQPSSIARHPNSISRHSQLASVGHVVRKVMAKMTETLEPNSVKPGHQLATSAMSKVITRLAVANVRPAGTGATATSLQDGVTRIHV